jgi:hypothetical protein
MMTMIVEEVFGRASRALRSLTGGTGSVPP